MFLYDTYNLASTNLYNKHTSWTLPVGIYRLARYNLEYTNSYTLNPQVISLWIITGNKAMSLEDLTESIVQLCAECNVWSSTIIIPHGESDVLDISDACGPNASTPNGAEVYPMVLKCTRFNVPTEGRCRTIHLILIYMVNIPGMTSSPCWRLKDVLQVAP